MVTGYNVARYSLKIDPDLSYDIQALKFLGRVQRQESIQDKEYLRVQENKVYMSQEYLF